MTQHPEVGATRDRRCPEVAIWETARRHSRNARMTVVTQGSRELRNSITLSHFQALTFRPSSSSRSSLLGLKKGILFGGTSTRAPVLGLRPMRPRLWRVWKLPNPRISTLSPDRRARTMLSNMVQRRCRIPSVASQWLGKPLRSDRPWSSGPSLHHDKRVTRCYLCPGHQFGAPSKSGSSGHLAVTPISSQDWIHELQQTVLRWHNCPRNQRSQHPGYGSPNTLGQHAPGDRQIGLPQHAPHELQGIIPVRAMQPRVAQKQATAASLHAFVEQGWDVLEPKSGPQRASRCGLNFSEELLAWRPRGPGPNRQPVRARKNGCVFSSSSRSISVNRWEY